MCKNIRLQPRDIEVIKRIIDFNGLPISCISNKYFAGSEDGRQRLKLLQNNNYLKQVLYYAPRNKDGKTYTQKVSAIYYATPKALREVNCNIDSRYVIPKEERLDVTNLIGKLFNKIPNLLSKRQTIEKYNLGNYMPIDCSVPNNNPMFVYILGRRIGQRDINTIRNFIKSKIPPNAIHCIISREFKNKLFLPEAHFIPWNMAEHFLPNIARDPYHYLREFLEIVEKQFPGIKHLSTPEPLIKANYQDRILHIGELFSGLNHIRLVLQEPPENTYIYTPNRQCFYGISLKKDNFLFYSKKDNQIFRMFLENSRMRSTAYY